jgi:hypothetical protein
LVINWLKHCEPMVTVTLESSAAWFACAVVNHPSAFAAFIALYSDGKEYQQRRDVRLSRSAMRTLNVNILADLAASWFTQQSLTPPPREDLIQIAEMAKQALIRHGTAVPAAAVPFAVEACIKAYLGATRTIARRVPALEADDDEVPVVFANLSPPPARKKARRTTVRKRRRRS